MAMFGDLRTQATELVTSARNAVGGLLELITEMNIRAGGKMAPDFMLCWATGTLRIAAA